MAQAVCTEDEFIRIFNELASSSLVSKALAIDIRTVQRRKKAIEHRRGIILNDINRPKDKVDITLIKERMEARIQSTRHNAQRGRAMDKGRVIVFSDAHFYPDETTTAYKALLECIKEFKPTVIVCNGDAFDGTTASRHARISWASAPTIKEELEACQYYMEGIEKANRGGELIWTLGNHDCLDDQTECLTKRGWLKHDELLPTDQILSIDGDKSVWTEINEIVKYPYSGDLIRIEKTRMSMAVTPNHRVLLNRLNWRTGQYDIREYRKASDLPSSFNMPMAANIENTEYDILDDAIRLCGWLLTDGCYEQYGMSIYQSKKEGQTEIERILISLGLKYSKYTRNRNIKSVNNRELLKKPLPQSQYRLSAESAKIVKKYLPRKKDLPEWMYQLSTRQFNVFLDSLIAGDGCWDGNIENKSCCVLYGEVEILSKVQALALTHGWRARIATDNRGDLRLCLAKEPKLRIEKKEVFKEHYEGTVWCLKVPYTNFMVRRNGSAYFTGNCRFESFLSNQISQYEGVTGFSLKDHFPMWKPCWSFWINDDTLIKHRWKGGWTAGRTNSLNAGVNIVTGHTHVLAVQPITDYSPTFAANGGTRYGVQTGTLADPNGDQFLDYTEANPKDWRSGFALLSFDEGRLLQPELIQVCGEDRIEFRGKIHNV